MRAPGGSGRRDTSRGPLLPQQSSPNPPWTGRKYSNYSLARLWLILAGPMASAINNLSSSEASGGTQGMGGLRSNHRGRLGGGDLWLAARIAQHRCESEVEASPR